MDIFNEISALSFPRYKKNHHLWIIWYMYVDAVNILSFISRLFTQHLDFRAQGLIFLEE